MEKLVDQAARERFDGRKLLGAQGSQLRVHALQLVHADLFSLLLQRDDCRSHVDRTTALMEALDLGFDECFGVAGLRLAFGYVRGGHLLQVVDIVNEDTFDLVHRRIDVTGHSDVDEEHWPVAAAMHELLSVLGSEDVMRSAGRADDNVGFGRGFVELVEWNHPTIKRLGQLAGPLEGAVGYEDGP